MPPHGHGTFGPPRHDPWGDWPDRFERGTLCGRAPASPADRPRGAGWRSDRIERVGKGSQRGDENGRLPGVRRRGSGGAPVVRRVRHPPRVGGRVGTPAEPWLRSRDGRVGRAAR